MSTRAQSLAALAFFLVTCGLSPAHAGFARQGGPICTATGDQEWQAMTTCVGGGAIIVWEDNRGYTDLYAQKIDNLGRIKWTLNGIGVCTYNYGQYKPSIADDGLGGAFIAWQDGRPNPNRDIYVQHIDGSGAALWTANGVAVCTAASDQSEPQVCADGFGGCIVAWVDGRVGLPQTDIYAQRVRADGNAAWTANGVAICTSSEIQQELRMAPDGKGGAIMAWADYRSGGDIYAQKIRPDGNVAWTANGKAVCSAANIQMTPDIVYDNKYGAIIAWSDQRTSYDIYTQRIDSLGDARWTANGIGLCIEATWQNYPKIAADGEGGASVTWLDYRGGDGDCYAQRVSPDGSVKWTANGIPICSVVGQCADIGIVPIAGKGYGLAWTDFRNGAGDIYAQGIDSTGTALLAPNGIAVCDTANAQIRPVGVSDGEGGAILVWKDSRGSTGSDIYAARINSQGEMVATLLQNYAAIWSGSGVEISWTLSEAGTDMRFTILRATAQDRAFTELDSREISREGMTFSFTDRSAEPGVSYLYRIGVSDENGHRILFETDAVPVPTMALTLCQNRPNPFNPSTAITYYVPEKCRVTLDIYDINGRLISRLADGSREKGGHTVQWNGRDENGNQVSSGVYLYRLSAGKVVISRKMVMLR